MKQRNKHQVTLAERKSRKRVQARRRSAHRRALKAKAAINDFTAAQWERLKEESGGLCSYCGRPSNDMTADHVIPLPKGGNHTLSNMTVACRKCNSRKGMRTPDEAHMRNRPGTTERERWNEARNRLVAVYDRRPDLPSIRNLLNSRVVSQLLDFELLEELVDLYEEIEPCVDQWKSATRVMDDVFKRRFGIPPPDDEEVLFRFPEKISDLDDAFLRKWIRRLRSSAKKLY